jgi:hypothetical protein
MAISFETTAQGYQTGLDDEISSAQQTHVAGRLLVVMISAWENATGAVTGVSDLAGNTFVKATNSGYIATDDGYVEIWYAKNINGYTNNVVTADFNGDHTYRQIIVHEYSGADPDDPLDQVGNNTGTGTSFTTPASSLNHNDEMIVASYATYDSGNSTAGSGFTLRNDLSFASSEDRPIGVKGSYGSALTFDTSTDWGGCHATFKRAPASKTWDGGHASSNNMTEGDNWVGDVAPNEYDDLIFAGGTRLTPNNNYTAGTEFNSITFSSTAGGFVIGGNQFTLTDYITNNDTQRQDINCAIILTKSDHYMFTTSGNIQLGGVISGTGFGLRNAGNNNLRLTATNTFTGQCRAFQGRITAVGNTSAFGAGEVVINGGELRINHNGSGDDGIITFTNNLLINSGQTGTIYVQNNGSNTGNTVVFPFINLGVSTLNIKGANGYKLKITDFSLRGGIAGNSTINPTTAPLFTGTFNNVSPDNHTAILSGSNSGNEIQGVMSESGGGTLSVIVNSTGIWKIGLDGTPPTNTYTGNTTITAGDLIVEPLTVTGLGSGTVTMNGGDLRLNRVTLSNAMTVASAAGKLIMNNGFGSVYSGNITLNANLTIESWFQPTGDQLISGNISGSSGITINLGSTNSDIRFTGNNTYSGATQVNDVRLIADSATALPSGSAFNLKDSAKTELYINGYVCTIGSLTGGGLFGGNVFLAGDQVSRLRIGNDNTDTTYEGVIDDGGSGAEGGIAKIGTGKLTLTGTNLYWWNTSVDDGTLIVNGSQFDNDEINVAVAATIGGSGTIKGDLNIANGGILSPGDASAAVLTVAAIGGHGLYLNNTSVINFTLGTVSDRVDVIGSGSGSDLQLDGILNITAGAGFKPGVYRIFNYNKTLFDNGLDIGTIPAGYKAVVDTSTAGQVNLVVTFDKPVNLVGNLDGGLNGGFQ